MPAPTRLRAFAPRHQCSLMTVTAVSPRHRGGPVFSPLLPRGMRTEKHSLPFYVHRGTRPAQQRPIFGFPLTVPTPFLRGPPTSPRAAAKAAPPRGHSLPPNTPPRPPSPRASPDRAVPAPGRGSDSSLCSVFTDDDVPFPLKKSLPEDQEFTSVCNFSSRVLSVPSEGHHWL